VLNQWLQIIGLTSAYFAGSWPARHERTSPWPTATVVVTLILCATALLQWIFPGVLAAYQRDARQIAAGEWWRLATALAVQDGGVAGTVSNLISLLLVGGAAERLWGSRRWLLIFVAGAVVSELIALAWQPIGAGNSVANFSLAGAVAVRCVLDRRSLAVRIAAAVTLAAGIALLALRDIHGAATLAGAAIALVFVARDRRPADS
jgi:membrane associated rhomboid family serine protease